MDLGTKINIASICISVLAIIISIVSVMIMVNL